MDKKRVHFAHNLVSAIIEVGSEDRAGIWEQIARDRERFMRRARQTESLLAPIIARHIETCKENSQSRNSCQAQE